MRIYCAWCRKYVGQKPPLEDKSTTHTICEECMVRVLKQGVKYRELSIEK